MLSGSTLSRGVLDADRLHRQLGLPPGVAATITFSNLPVKTSPTKPVSPASDSARTKSPAAGTPDAVPMLDLRRQYEQIKGEVLAAVERVCGSQHYILGS